MTPQTYILSTLEKLAEPTVSQDPAALPIEDAILAKVLSKKFRKLKADEATVKAAKTAIHYAVTEQKPAVFSLLFGGNKLWRFDEAPEVDWAELFAMAYYARWLKTIADIYEPGAQLVLYSQDVSVERLNNVPREETNNYSRTFRDMLAWLQPYLPKGVSIVYRRQLEEYADPAEYDQEIEAARKMVLEEDNGQLPEMDEAQKIATELNVKLKPGQDGDPLWREKVELEHQAVFLTKTIERFFAEPGRIPISPTAYSGLLVTGSTKKSIAKFWAGVGALEQVGDTYSELVLTPKQLASAKCTWEDIHIIGLSGKNFSKIRVIKAVA